MGNVANIKRPLALVTGATSGIGHAITLSLIEMGYEVLALGRSETKLAEMQAIPGVHPLAIDLTDREALAGAIEGVEIDVLVNNAGIIPPTVGFAEMEQSDIDTTLEVNLSAAITATHLVVPGMMARKTGHIFFIGSTAGHHPFPKMAVYSASKAAISAFAAALRCDIAGSGVRTTEVVAGRVETGLYRKVLSDSARADMYSAFDPVQPEDIAQMLISALQMPPHVDVTRFDVMPTAQYVGGGGFASKES